MSVSQSTMGQAVEIGIEKILKSNRLVFGQLWSKSDNSFFDWCKTVNILQANSFFANMMKNVAFLDKKPEELDCET